MTLVAMSSCCAASAVTGPIEATTVEPQEVDRLIEAEHGDEIPDRRGARERDRIDLAVEQHAVDVRLAVPIDPRRDRPVRGDVEHERARLAQLVGEQIARDVRPRQQEALALDVAGRLERLDDRLGPELGRRQVDADAVTRDARGRRRPDGADADALQLAHVARGEQPLHEVLDAVGAREDDPVERRRVVAGAVERVGVLGRRDADRRRRDRLGAALLEHLDELARLLARPGDDDALAEERPIVEPAQVLAQPGDGADDEQRRPPSRARAPMSPSVPWIVSCDGSVPS